MFIESVWTLGRCHMSRIQDVIDYILCRYTFCFRRFTIYFKIKRMLSDVIRCYHVIMLSCYPMSVLSLVSVSSCREKFDLMIVAALLSVLSRLKYRYFDLERSLVCTPRPQHPITQPFLLTQTRDCSRLLDSFSSFVWLEQCLDGTSYLSSSRDSHDYNSTKQENYLL